MNKVIARVEGREITEGDLTTLLRNLGENSQYFQGPDGREKLIDELIMYELMYLDALENNLDQEQDFILLMNNMKKSMLQQYNLRKMLSEISAREEELRNYYMAHINDYKTKETVKASHILVDSQEKAYEVLEEITDGLSFEEAAKNYSSCPSKQNGGDLGTFTKGQMVKEFEDKAFSMQNGEISEPVKTEFGYHIIMVIDHIEERNSKFEDVYQEIKEHYLLQKQENAYINKKSNLSKKYTIEIL